jgi:hypothetical protein
MSPQLVTCEATTFWYVDSVLGCRTCVRRAGQIPAFLLYRDGFRILAPDAARIKRRERPLELDSVDGLAAHLGCQFDDLLLTPAVQPVDRRVNSIRNAQATTD